MVLVTEPILKCVEDVGGFCSPSIVVPLLTGYVPDGVVTRTIAPGTRSASAVSSTVRWTAAWSIGTRPEGPVVGGVVDDDEEDDERARRQEDDDERRQEEAKGATVARRRTKDGAGHECHRPGFERDRADD